MIKNTKNSHKQGFASMSDEKRKAISRKGGQIAHLKGKAHKFNTEEGRKAGRKGGVTVSKDKAHMARIGRKGGQHKKTSE